MKRSRGGEIDLDEISLDAYSSGDLNIKEKPLDSLTFIFANVATLAFVLLFLGRVGFLALVKNDLYLKRAGANINKVVIQPAPRGIIKDRYGDALVSNTPILSAYLKPSEVIKNSEQAEVVKVVDILSINNQNFLDLLNKNNLQESDTVLLKKDISNEEAIKLKSLNLSSLIIENDFKRSFDPAFAHIVGYTGLVTDQDLKKNSELSIYDYVGKTGLEASFDAKVRGVNGEKIIIRNVGGKTLEEKVVAEPKVGEDFLTTIDAGLQKVFYQRLVTAMSVLDEPQGAVGIAIDPRNGDVLSLVSLPSFSSGDIGKALTNSKKPLFNRAISGLYSPGSVMKVFLATAGLQEGVVIPSDKIYSSGVLEVPNPYFPDQPSRFVDFKARGWVNLHEALAVSSNIYFYALGGGLPYNETLYIGTNKNFSGLGIENIKKYADIFGLNQKTGIQLPSEAKGLVPYPEEKKARTGANWRLGDTYLTSIGQGDVDLTPISVINAVASIANGGTLYKPNLVLNKTPELIRDYTYLSNSLKEVVIGMRDTIFKPYGTCTMLADLAYPSIGKTGSAQFYNNAKVNAFFVGCGPVPWDESKPPICVLVLVENAKTGAQNAVPVAKDVLSWYYKNRIR